MSNILFQSAQDSGVLKNLNNHLKPNLQSTGYFVSDAEVSLSSDQKANLNLTLKSNIPDQPNLNFICTSNYNFQSKSYKTAEKIKLNEHTNTPNNVWNALNGINWATRILTQTPIDCGALANLTNLPHPLTAPQTFALQKQDLNIMSQSVQNPETGETSIVSSLKRGSDAPEKPWEVINFEQMKALFEKEYGLLNPSGVSMDEKFRKEIEEAARQTPEKVFPIVLYLKGEENFPSFPSFDSLRRLGTQEKIERFMQEHYRQRQESVATLQKRALPELKRGGLTQLTPSSFLPLYFSEATAPQILQLSQKPNLLLMLGDNRKSTYTPTTSLATNTCSIGAPFVPIQQLPVNQVRVGIMEVDKGVTRDLKLCGLDRRTFYYLDGYSETDHASAVASIVGSKNGVAPGAKIHSIALPNELGTQIFEKGLGWGLERGIQIYNMSFGSPEEGKYQSEERIIDAMIYASKSTIVVAAGNKGTDNELDDHKKGITCSDSKPYVSAPGNAYNVITVGNAAVTQCATPGYVSNNSCFQDPHPAGRHKPEVAAPGSSITVPFNQDASVCLTLNGTGTSFSAPFVSGASAVLVAKEPALGWAGDAMHAILMASAVRLQAETDLPSVQELSGAGAINLGLAYETLITDNLKVVGEDEIKKGWFYDFSVAPGTTKVRVVITWLKKQTIFTDLKMMAMVTASLYDREDLKNPLVTAYDFYNNYLVMDYYPKENETRHSYKVKINNHLGSLISDRFAVAVSAQPLCSLKWGDKDKDGICNGEDNCSGDSNSDQSDKDKDGIGDVCDPCLDLPTNDQDKDKIANECDNCPTIYNPDQANHDTDTKGDACDLDDDNDGCEDSKDENPISPYGKHGNFVAPFCDPAGGVTYSSDSEDSDGDSIKNCQDPDDDNDGIPDKKDNCPHLPYTGRSGGNHLMTECQKLFDPCTIPPNEHGGHLPPIIVINPEH